MLKGQNEKLLVQSNILKQILNVMYICLFLLASEKSVIIQLTQFAKDNADLRVFLEFFAAWRL